MHTYETTYIYLRTNYITRTTYSMLFYKKIPKKNTPKKILIAILKVEMGICAQCIRSVMSNEPQNVDSQSCPYRNYPVVHYTLLILHKRGYHAPTIQSYSTLYKYKYFRYKMLFYFCQCVAYFQRIFILTLT